MADTFPSMSKLLNALSARDNYVVHADGSRGSRVKIFAPHGGCIEPGTEALALAISLDRFDYFIFSGKRKKGCFQTLHVTSTHYDEPRCLQMAQEAEVALAIHGCDGDESAIHVGGGNVGLVSNLCHYFDDQKFPAFLATGQMKGEDERNFINRSQQKGVQIELSVGFRKHLFPGFPKTVQRHPQEFPRFVESMRRWLMKIDHNL